MTDIILGMGEVGETLFNLLVDRKFDCIGIDLDNSKCKNYTENEIIENPQYLHVCLPGELTGFTDIVVNWINKIKKYKSGHNTFNCKTRNHKNYTRKIFNANFILTSSWST